MAGEVRLIKGQPISFEKETVAPGQFYLWVMWARMLAALDLDLIAIWVDGNGQKGIIQALSGHGSKDRVPYLWLPEDNRTGGGEGEWIYGDMKPMLQSLRWLGLGLFNYGSNVPLSAAEGAVAMIKVPGQPKLVFPLDNIGSDVCSLAQISIDGGNMHVKHDVMPVRCGRGVYKQQALAEYWGIHFNWRAASK